MTEIEKLGVGVVQNGNDFFSWRHATLLLRLLIGYGPWRCVHETNVTAHFMIP
jgi:hypothetical protein